MGLSSLLLVCELAGYCIGLLDVSLINAYNLLQVCVILALTGNPVSHRCSIIVRSVHELKYFCLNGKIWCHNISFCYEYGKGHVVDMHIEHPCLVLLRFHSKYIISKHEYTTFCCGTNSSVCKSNPYFL